MYFVRNQGLPSSVSVDIRGGKTSSVGGKTSSGGGKTSSVGGEITNKIKV